jgi:hypothetical protein
MLDEMRERNAAAYLALTAKGPAPAWAKQETAQILSELAQIDKAVTTGRQAEADQEEHSAN